MATVPLGLARGALAEFLGLAAQRKRRGDSVPLAERELGQSQVGQIEARLSASRAYLRQVVPCSVETLVLVFKDDLLHLIDGDGELAVLHHGLGQE